ncbi:hypothetical protein F2Q70_00031423 [Brassica cretica]|uniref:Uncharacterized protein n=1 Tax=Brassica cretica TaxID=69181 RepID=A0A8S9FD00_BRACR|nr:hypothetical protein F2Q70_00031423 [Brassica cretica]
MPPRTPCGTPIPDKDSYGHREFLRREGFSAARASPPWELHLHHFRSFLFATVVASET